MSTSTIDLSEFGHRSRTELCGDIVDSYCFPGAPLVFLFDENHEFLYGIDQSVRNAMNLIDGRIVDFVGVEGYSGPICQIIEGLLREAGCPSIQDATERIKLMRTSPEDLVRQGLGFAGALALSRPDVPIYGIEDAEAHAKAGSAVERKEEVVLDSMLSALSECLGESLLDAIARSDERKMQDIVRKLGSESFLDKLLAKGYSDVETHVRDTVQGERPGHFVANFFALRKRCGSRLPGIINAGKRDQDEVATILRADNSGSFIRVRPHDFPDALEGVSQHERLMKEKIIGLSRRAADSSAAAKHNKANRPDETDARP